MADEVVSKQLVILQRSVGGQTDWLMTLSEAEATEAVKTYQYELWEGGRIGYAFDVQLANLVALRRFRLPKNGDRLYTTDPDEAERARIQGYVDEGISAYIASVSRDGTVPLIRYLNFDQGSHFYNASAKSTGDWSMENGVYRKEGTLGYIWESPTTLPRTSTNPLAEVSLHPD
jgi:hypothetical protein